MSLINNLDYGRVPGKYFGFGFSIGKAETWFGIWHAHIHFRKRWPFIIVRDITRYWTASTCIHYEHTDYDEIFRGKRGKEKIVEYEKERKELDNIAPNYRFYNTKVYAHDCRS